MVGRIGAVSVWFDALAPQSDSPWPRPDVVSPRPVVKPRRRGDASLSAAAAFRTRVPRVNDGVGFPMNNDVAIE